MRSAERPLSPHLPGLSLATHLGAVDPAPRDRRGAERRDDPAGVVAGRRRRGARKPMPGVRVFSAPGSGLCCCSAGAVRCSTICATASGICLGHRPRSRTRMSVYAGGWVVLAATAVLTVAAGSSACRIGAAEMAEPHPRPMRSPLGRAIGLGSAKEGVEHWWAAADHRARAGAADVVVRRSR